MIDRIHSSYAESTIIHDKGDAFTGRATKVKTYNETREAVRQILRNPETISAIHNIYAYKFTDKDGKTHKGFEDDGEFDAGTKLLKHICEHNVDDVLVIVSRNAGDKLDPLRFTHIINVGNAALAEL
ncbi:hypothetical protein KUTeg_006074 [Tegillarca granosa]|uniref:Impact N-terminal domain-containing protein n=1 Tax=Tegillarca granosa TaxID=220873 RepID=A0ABQ9FIE3_TEGGR|nr:hypothetical protein KUTeg_006074 [Tegillarca granosa]